jgi:hypothetical protein
VVLALAQPARAGMAHDLPRPPPETGAARVAARALRVGGGRGGAAVHRVHLVDDVGSRRSRVADAAHVYRRRVGPGAPVPHHLVGASPRGPDVAGPPGGIEHLRRHRRPPRHHDQGAAAGVHRTGRADAEPTFLQRCAHLENGRELRHGVPPVQLQSARPAAGRIALQSGQDVDRLRHRGCRRRPHHRRRRILRDVQAPAVPAGGRRP